MILADDYIINSRGFPEEILSGSDLFPRQADKQEGRPEWSVSAKPFAVSQGGVMGRGEFQISRGRGCARENPLRVFPARFPSARRSAPIRTPVPFGPESSEANRVRKRRNSHQSAVFGKAGNGTAAGISELCFVDKKDTNPKLLRCNGF